MVLVNNLHENEVKITVCDSRFYINRHCTDYLLKQIKKIERQFVYV